MSKRKERNDVGLASGLARAGTHYKTRDAAVGISPQLTSTDKRYAKFSDLAYEYGASSAGDVNAMLSEKHPGWVRSHYNDKESVFHNEETKEMIYSAKGTNPASMEDIKSDIRLTRKPFTKWDEIPRMRESLKSFQAYKEQYSQLGYDKFSVTGHSLGGGVALYIADKEKVKATVFNPSLPVTRFADNVSIPTSRIIRTNYDIVSRGRTAIVDGERLTVPVSDGKRGFLSAHAMKHFMDPAEEYISKSKLDKISGFYDENAPKAFGALSAALTGAQLFGDVRNRDPWSFTKHATEAVVSTNPVGAAAVTSYEVGSSIVKDIREGNTKAALKDGIEGTALGVGAFFGAAGLLLGGTVAGATEIAYRTLGHAHPRKRDSESMSGAVTEAGMSLGHLVPGDYAESTAGKADSRAARSGL